MKILLRFILIAHVFECSKFKLKVDELVNSLGTLLRTVISVEFLLQRECVKRQ